MTLGSPTVGFDLDMTLIDSRPGIAAALRELSSRTGVYIDVEAAVGRLGPPLEDELGYWFPAADIDEVVREYRSLYPQYAVAPTVALAGAHEAIAAVHEAGGRVVVVTAKRGDLAALHLGHLGLAADHVYGSVFRDGKARVLRDESAWSFVGDHVADMEAAVSAGVPAVGVGTGPCDAAELTDAGADVVLADLTQFPEWFATALLARRLRSLAEALRKLGRVVVAYSGGADSAFVLAAAVRELGPGNVLAATACSPSLPATELEAARLLPRLLGVEHLTVPTNELDQPGYRDNGADRCYFCKAELVGALTPIAAGRGAVVVTGTNADDAVAGFRPGIRAADERGAHAVLRDAGFTKRQVRQASREWGLPTWDKPAAACLSSRIAYGVAISPERLARVERAEAALRAALRDAGIDVADLRVRDLGDAGARVEVDADAVPLVAASIDLSLVLAEFSSVVLDPRGFRSGSLNEDVSRS